jgi:hypothetical protein
VAVRYLQRAARRLVTVGAENGATSVRPAIPSRSPLAEADQRLNLDSFAARFNAPLVPGPTAPMIAEEAAATTPLPERQPVIEHEAAGPPAANARPTPPGPRPGVHREPTKLGRAGTKRREVPAHAPTRPGTRAAPAGQRSAHGHPETPPAPLQPPDRASRRRVNALPAAAADQGRAPAPEHARPAPASLTGGAGPAAREAAAQPMLDALSRAMSWVEGQPDRRPDRGPEREGVEERGTPAAVARPPFRESSPAWPTRAVARGRAPVTQLEIGRIEVEIVPPPKPAPPAAPPRPAPKTNGPGSALRPPFGWRQR